MVCFDTCFCFRDVRSATVAIAMLTGGCSFIQILITIAVFTGVGTVDVSNNSKEATTYQLYIALACFDFIMLIASFILGYGSQRSEGMSRCYTLPWAILLPFYFIYETGINIYYFYYQFNSNGYQAPLVAGAAAGFVIVPLVYWIAKAILMFVSFLYIVTHLQRLNMNPRVRYARQVESFHEYESAPSFPHPTPKIALPAAPTMCSPSPMMSMPGCNKPPMMSMPPSMPACSKPPMTYMPPSMPACSKTPMMSMPPSFPRPSSPQCTSCSGGCSADRCGKCNLPQPLYGYAGMQNGNSGVQLGNNMGNAAGPVQSKGWTTSVFNTGL